MLHLLKESSRPVPKQKKRRKISALAIPDGTQSAAGMEASNQNNNGDEEEKKEHSNTRPLGSKRNTSRTPQFNI